MLSAFAYAMITQVLDRLAAAKSSVAIGSLSLDPPVRPEGAALFDVVLISAILGLFVCSLFRRYLATRHKWTGGLRATWWLCGSSFFILALYIPLLHGTLLRSTEYVRAIVILKSGVGICGLLVAESDKEIRLWRNHQGVGEVLVLPSDGVKELRLGQPADLLTLAAKSTDSRSVCPIETGGTSE